MAVGTGSCDPDFPIPFDACDPTGTFVFVSYAHQDRTLAYPELLRIRSLGIRVWYDEGIEPGSEWPEAIANALKRAAAFVVFITPSAVASRNVRNEINAALSWDKPFFAVHLAQTELPLGLELQMGHVQAVMRWHMDEGSYTRKLGKALAGWTEAKHETPPVVMPGHAACTLGGHTSSLSGVTFSPDGRLLATASFDKTARLWDPATSKHLHTLTGHYSPLSGVVFSPDGRLLATASFDETARLWDPATGNHLRTLTRHDSELSGVVFSPDGRLLATASHDETVRLWDPATGMHLHTLTGHTVNVRRVVFSPDGRLLATASDDMTARLWDPATGMHLHTLTGHTGEVNAVTFSPDGRLLATAGSDNAARLWDPATAKHLRTLTGHGAVFGVLFSPDGRLLATSGRDDTVRLWE